MRRRRSGPLRVRSKPAQAQLPISPSSTLLRFADRIASSGSGLVLDVACGHGRNAVVMAARGRTVVLRGPRRPDREGVIEIAFGCGARLRLRGEVSSETLRQVIELLR
jgi:hypothetical protein